MMYWLIKLQEIILTPFFIVYYSARHIHFYTRCRHCHRWLSERQYLRLGICEKCSREMVSSDTYYSFLSKEYPKNEIKRMVFPTKTAFDSIYRRVGRSVGRGKVLDVGCGQGYVLSGVNSTRSELYGMDIEKLIINAANSWIPDAAFCLADARKIPFKSDTFDYLICTEVLEHIDDNSVINECYRVLKPDGRAIFTVPIGKGTSGKINPTHIRLFTSKSIAKALNDSGFDISVLQPFGLYVPFISPFLELLIRASGRHLPMSGFFDVEVPEWLATNFLIECRKPVKAND